jgi:peptidoglycan/xylan/chitin deacetylase (PgdA/CDA1 family)
MHNVPHSVMFHHFHDDKHLPAQGSLSYSDFINMIEWLNKHYSLLSASQFKYNFENGTLKDTDICLSFDDALQCQYDIAVPVMERLGIQAFFFVYSSAFSQTPDPLEIYRYFRTTCYSNVDKFYKDFFDSVEQIDAAEFSRHHTKYLELNYLAAFPFYTEKDKWFRYLRDKYLVRNQYDEIMNELMIKNDFDANAAKKDLWMSEEDLTIIESKGHLIGLHSYSHPTQMSKLSKAEQKLEYQNNYDHLEDLIGKPIKVMSHPCGDYNEITLQILKSMEIDIGFRSNMSMKEIRSPLEIPREDHANVLKEMRL